MSKWNRLTNMLCLVLDGVGVADWMSQPSSWMSRHLPHLLEVVSPSSYGASTAEDLAILPLSVGAKEKLIKNFGSLESALEKNEAFKAFRFVNKNMLSF